MRKLLVAVALVCFGATGCGEQSRQVRPESDLLDLRRQNDGAMHAQVDTLFDRVIEVASEEQDDHAAGRRSIPPTMDILVISGGGDWGAFGAGVLKGWGTLPANNPLARPEFDIVTGVSTGALIAPFAFIGDDDAIERINALYRNPKSDWVKTRGPLYFMPSNISFAAIPGLERDLRQTVDMPLVARIADAAERGRFLGVNTTNLDDGGPRVFDLVVEAQAARQSGQLDRIHDIMLASAGIPGVFPFRIIDGEMLVDGGVTSNIIYGGRINDQESIPAAWRRKYGDRPMPKLRYWVLFNNQLRTGPRTVEPRWLAVVQRSLELSVRYATVTAIRHLLEIARNARATLDADVEVRILAIPNDWKPPKEGTFVKETMNDLTDLGERMGADPASWLTELPK